MRFQSIILLIFLAASSTFSIAKKLDPSLSTETITVGFFPEDYPPLYWHQGKKGIIQQTLDLISERSRFRFEPKHYPFNRLIKNVGNGSLDLEAWTSPAWRQAIKDKVYFTEQGNCINLTT